MKICSAIGPHELLDTLVGMNQLIEFSDGSKSNYVFGLPVMCREENVATMEEILKGTLEVGYEDGIQNLTKQALFITVLWQDGKLFDYTHVIPNLELELDQTEIYGGPSRLELSGCIF